MVESIINQTRIEGQKIGGIAMAEFTILEGQRISGNAMAELIIYQARRAGGMPWGRLQLTR